jgi:ribosomal protein L14
MVKIGAYAYCIDNTGVYFVKIFQAIGSKFKREVTLGDVVYITVRGVNTGAHFLKDERVRFKFRKGSVHRAVIVHVSEKYRRRNRSYIWFPRNAVVLLTRTLVPYSNRVKLGIPKEIADDFPSIASMCPKVL